MRKINENIIGKSLSKWTIISCEIDNDYYFSITLKNNVINKLISIGKHIYCHVNYDKYLPILYIRNNYYINKIIANDYNLHNIDKSINNVIILDSYCDDRFIEQICFGLIDKNKINELDKYQLALGYMTYINLNM